MAYHVESAGGALRRLEDAATRRERTVRRAGDDSDRVERADLHHVMTVRNTRRQVRFNGALPNLDRGVLGSAGSPELLKRYKELARRVGEAADEPLVALQTVSGSGDRARVEEALVGTITGDLQARTGFSQDVADRRKQTVRLVVPTSPMMSFTRAEEDWRIAAAEGASVTVAEIDLNEYANDGLDPNRDFTVQDRVEEGTLLLGGQAIRDSHLFEPDLRNIVMLAGESV